MPVFTRLCDGVFVVVVDGDFTSGEVRRAGERGLGADDVPDQVPVLLDLSGAAGIHAKSDDDLRAVGEFFGEREETTTRVAVLAPSDDASELMDSWGAFAEALGSGTQAFQTRDEAMIFG